MSHPQPEPYDLLGVGIGPFNLSLAALADGVEGFSSLFCEARAEFRWHPGMLVDGARMQVPFLADLVSLVDPTSPWSFLNHLRDQERLFPFYFAERFQLSRAEYDHYCRWAAERLANCRFGTPVRAVHWAADEELFRVELPHGEVWARNVVLGVGTRPTVPEPFIALRGHPRIWHSAEYLERRGSLAGARDITVLGPGQSGAEVFLDLLRARAGDGTRLRWLTRTRALAPMGYSKLGLEHFTPDYTRYFHTLPEPVRDALVPRQWQLYKAASAETLAAVHEALYERTTAGSGAGVEIVPGTEVLSAGAADGGGLELHCAHRQSDDQYALRTDLVVLATGYAARRPALLDPVHDLVDWDVRGRYRIGLDYRVGLRPVSPPPCTCRTPSCTRTESARPISVSAPTALPSSSTPCAPRCSAQPCTGCRSRRPGPPTAAPAARWTYPWTSAWVRGRWAQPRDRNTRCTPPLKALQPWFAPDILPSATLGSALWMINFRCLPSR